MEPLIQLLVAAHGTPAAIATWLALVVLVVWTLHAVVRLLHAALRLRNDWFTRRPH